MPSEPYDNWHKSRPKLGEETCKEHNKVPSKRHGVGKRWAARWRDPQGNQEQELFARFDDARKFLTKMEGSIDNGVYIPRDGPKTKFKVVCHAWLHVRKGKSPRTYAQYESRIENHIIEPLGEVEIGDIKPSTIVQWINGRREHGLDETTIGLVFTHLSAIFESAIDDDVIGKNPCRGKSVRDMKPKRSKPPARDVPLTGTQTDEIREHLPARYKAIVDVGRGLGLRQGEIFGLGPDDIDWSEKLVHVTRQIAFHRGTMVFAPPKCSDTDEDKDRFVPASEEVLFRLMAHMAEHPPVEVTLPWKTIDGELHTAQLLFTSREHKPLNKNYINWVWKAALEAAGIIKAINHKPLGRGRLWEKCRDKMMHALRHLYASERIAEGMDVFTLARRMGHADPTYTLRKYVHQVDNDYETERARIDRTLRSGSVPRSAPDVQR